MRNGSRFAIAVLFVAALAVSLAAQEKQDKPEQVRPPKLNFTTHTLANGLQVILLEDHAAPVINLQVWYHVGSKDEQPGHTGFAHLFEHLMFKGSAHVGTDEHSRIIEAVGGFDNAETGDDTTNFFETFPSNYLERILWLEADRMGSLNVDEANFKSEREVVKEERRVRVDNQPYGLLEEDLRAAAFTVHGYHHTAIGSMADLDKATIEDVRAFFNTFYKPNNATLIIVGDFKSDEALGWAKKYFEGIPASAKPIPRIDKSEPVQTEERVVNKSYSNTPLPAAVIGYKIPARYAPDSYSLDLASNILAGGESSRLYQTLVYKDVIAVLDELKTKPVEAREFDKAENQEISGFILGRNTDEEKAVALGAAAVIGKNPDLANTELGHYLKLIPADVQRAAEEYFVAKHATVLLVKPAAQ